LAQAFLAQACTLRQGDVLTRFRTFAGAASRIANAYEAETMIHMTWLSPALRPTAASGATAVTGVRAFGREASFNSAAVTRARRHGKTAPRMAASPRHRAPTAARVVVARTPPVDRLGKVPAANEPDVSSVAAPCTPDTDSTVEEPLVAGDIAWASTFGSFKAERLQVRRQLSEAIHVQDFAKLGTLRAAWLGEVDFPASVISNQGQKSPCWVAAAAERLAMGRNLVTGTCFVHRKFGYRGVVIACEPRCSGSAAWQVQMGVNKLSRGEAQPFYHCLVDDRDRPGGQITLVAEENMEPSESAYPVQSPLLDLLFVRCDGLGGYLPSPQLEKALARQFTVGTFTFQA